MRLPGQQQDELWAAVNRGDGAAVQQQLASLRMAPTPVSSSSSSSTVPQPSSVHPVQAF